MSMLCCVRLDFKRKSLREAQERCMYDSTSLSVFSGCPTEPSGFHWQHKLALTFVSGHFLFISLKLTFPTDTFSLLPFRELLDFPQGEAAARSCQVYCITWTLEESGRKKSCRFGEMQKTHLKLLRKWQAFKNKAFL